MTVKLMLPLYFSLDTTDVTKKTMLFGSEPVNTPFKIYFSKTKKKKKNRSPNTP